MQPAVAAAPPREPAQRGERQRRAQQRRQTQRQLRVPEGVHRQPREPRVQHVVVGLVGLQEGREGLVEVPQPGQRLVVADGLRRRADHAQREEAEDHERAEADGRGRRGAVGRHRQGSPSSSAASRSRAAPSGGCSRAHELQQVRADAQPHRAEIAVQRARRGPPAVARRREPRAVEHDLEQHAVRRAAPIEREPPRLRRLRPELAGQRTPLASIGSSTSAASVAAITAGAVSGATPLRVQLAWPRSTTGAAGASASSAAPSTASAARLMAPAPARPRDRSAAARRATGPPTARAPRAAPTAAPP